MAGTEERTAQRSSRTSAHDAGWRGPEERRGSYVDLLARRENPTGRYSWIGPGPFIDAINDFWTRRVKDFVNEERARRVAFQRAAGVEERFPDFVVDRTDLDTPSFIVLGDPGEGDASQYAVVAPLCAKGEDTDFMVLCSDVVYPAGDVNEYVDKHYLPYEGYDRPIYAIPGNHDWYDNLDGFMWHFCAAEQVPLNRYRLRFADRMARILWRKSTRPDRAKLSAWRHRRPGWRDGPPRPLQPGPYFAIDTGPLLIVCIDPGVANEIDREQGEWLLRMSRRDKPKILVTGKPLIVDYDYEPTTIKWGVPHDEHGTVDLVVRDPAFGYVAAIGGDVHNYQRYPVPVGDRTVQYVVNGGGGAYLHATHRLPPGSRPEGGRWDPSWPFPGEREVRLYPLRGDSLARFTPSFVRLLTRALPITAFGSIGALLVALYLWTAAEGFGVFDSAMRVVAVVLWVAALLMTVLTGHFIRAGVPSLYFARRATLDADTCARHCAGHDGEPVRDEARGREIDPGTQRLLDVIGPLKTREHGPIFKLYSELFDSDEPPFFKSFVRLRADDDALQLECFGVTGWAADERDPTLEDAVSVPLRPAAPAR